MDKLYEWLGIPFGWLLYGLFRLGIHNYAVLIVIITLLVRLIMIPSSINQQKGMAKTQRMQSKIKKIQEKCAGDQRKIQEETQALYQREGYNPMNAGCMPMLIQFILLFGLIGVIYYPLSNFLHISDAELKILKDALSTIGVSISKNNTRLYELYIIENIDKIKELNLTGISAKTWRDINAIEFSIGGMSLGKTPKEGGGVYWLIPIISTITTIASSVYSTIRQNQSGAQNAQAAKSMGCMTVGMALFSLYFVINFPTGIGVYWIASGVLGLLSTVILGQLYSPKKMLARIMIDETIERRSREKNIIVAADNKEEEK